MLILAGLVALTVALPPQQPPTPGTHADDDARAMAFYEQGWEDMGAERWDQAAAAFQKALDLNPRMKLAYYGLGRAQMGLKQFGPATQAYQTCRDLYETEAGLKLSNKAEAERLMADDATQLTTAIQKLGAISSAGNTSSNLQAMHLRQQLNDMKTRSRVMDTASLTSHAPAFVWLALGSAYFRGQRIADAEKAYKIAVELDPKAGEAWNNLAVVYLETGRYDDADKAVKAAEKAGYHVNPGLKDDIKKRKTAR